MLSMTSLWLFAPPRLSLGRGEPPAELEGRNCEGSNPWPELPPSWSESRTAGGENAVGVRSLLSKT